MAMPRPRLSMWLLLATAIVGGVVYLERDNGLFAPPPRQLPNIAPIATESIALRSAPTLPPISDFSEITERPLFSQTRRPPEPPTVEAPPPEEPAPVERNLFTVVGIAVSEQERAALVQVRRTREIVRVAEGDEVDGWKVTSIETNNVVFEKGALRDTVEIQHLGDVEEQTPRPQRRPPARPAQRPTAR